MPIYEYECRQCGSRTEVLQKVTDSALERCEGCGGELRRLLSAPAFQFKGSGWYVTDYARKGSQDTGKAAASNGASSGGSTDKAEGSDSGAKSGDSGSTAATKGS